MNTLGPLRANNNARYTQALFLEYARENVQPSFTVKNEHVEKQGVVYPSLRRVYMECMDPTEEQFVAQVFDGDWEHWQRIKDNDILRTALKYEEWEEELSIKLRSFGIRSVINEVRNNGRSSFSAAKWLAEGQWKGTKRGRPSNDEKARIAREERELYKELQDDLKRVQDI
jgi:hypothetical protein